MTDLPNSKQYERTSPWSINANERAYSIDPWSFQSANITILDLRLRTRGPNNWGWDNDQVTQITGNAKFPDFGFIGGEEYSNELLKMGEYLIYPIDDERIENEFQEGLQHYKSALDDFRDEFDQLSPIEVIEKFGNPHKFGVCRITASPSRDGFFRISVRMDIFKELYSAILRVGVSKINIRFRLWNVYKNEKLYPQHIGGEAHSSSRVFLIRCHQQMYNYVSHGIIEDIYIDYSYNKSITDSGYNYYNEQINELMQGINVLKQNDVLIDRFITKIYDLLISIFVLIIIISLAFAIWS